MRKLIELILLAACLVFINRNLVKASEWERRMYEVEKTDEDYVMSMCKPYRENCVNKTSVPYHRQGHVAILYTSFSYDQCANYASGQQCTVFTL